MSREDMIMLKESRTSPDHQNNSSIQDLSVQAVISQFSLNHQQKSPTSQHNALYIKETYSIKDYE